MPSNNTPYRLHYCHCESWVLGQGSTQGAISVKYRYKIGFDHNIGQAECQSELPRPNGWCPFSGTLWTHESTQVLWCSWVLWQGSTQGAISIKLRFKIGFDHNIGQAERQSVWPRPNGPRSPPVYSLALSSNYISHSQKLPENSLRFCCFLKLPEELGKLP